MDPICGVIMPIGAIAEYTEAHWIEVKNILFESIQKSGFNPNLVSDSDDVGVIHKRIIKNIYDNPIVVCDISGRNPNVMFELGMRLAFDKPTILVKDDSTNFPFDIAIIEHLIYKRDLNYSNIQDFKEKLSKKLIKTFEASINNKDYTTFLKHFGQFKLAQLDTVNLPMSEIMLDEIKGLKNLVGISQNFISKISTQIDSRKLKNYDGLPWSYGIRCEISDLGIAEELANIISVFPTVVGVQVYENKSAGGFNIFVHDIEEAPYNTFKRIEGIVDVYGESIPIMIYTGL